MKVCSKCQKEKALSDFHSHPTASQGVSHRCKLCHREWAKISYQKRKSHIIAKAKEWAEENPSRRREIVNKSDFKNRVQKRIKSMERYHRLKIEKPEHLRLLGVQAAAIRRLRMEGVENNITSSKQLKEIIERANNICIYCGQPVKKLTIDHFQPVSQNGAHSVENLVPCCRPCNASKNAKTAEDWIEKHFGFNGLTRTLLFLEGKDFKVAI